MARLTEQFFAAMREWSRRTASSDEDLRLILLNSVGPYDAKEVTECNLNTNEQRINVLVDDLRLSERFLIVALIREVEDVLEARLADAEKGEQSRGVIRAREAKRRIIEHAKPQERESPAFQQQLRHFEAFERSIFPTPEKIAQHKRWLETWRDVTRPLMASG